MIFISFSVRQCHRRPQHCHPFTVVNIPCAVGVGLPHLVYISLSTLIVYNTRHNLNLNPQFPLLSRQSNTTTTITMWLISYWVLPTISACAWLGMLIAMITVWATSSNRQLPSMDPGQKIAYISDVGAFSLKPLFIACSAVTAVCLDLGLVAERWLRHTGRLAPNTSVTQKVLSIFSLFFAFAGAAGLICLTIFDTYRHDTVHNICLLIFIGGYVISAIFLCAEYQRLGIHYRHHRVLALSFWIKLAFIFIEMILAIVFASTSYTRHRNVAAVFEWAVSFIFTFYALSFIVDLWPSVRTKKHVPQGHRDVMMAERGMNEPRFSQQSTRQASFEQNMTTDSAGPNQPGPKYTFEGANEPRNQKHGIRRFF